MVKKKYLTTLSVVIVSVLLGSLVYNNVAFASKRKVKYNLYFGDLHTHTIYSDAWEGTPWDAFAAAKAAGADFMAVTDHDCYDNYLTPEEWADTLLAADYYTSDDFVAMAGYEHWMAGLGEINVYNTPNFPPKINDAATAENPGNHYNRFDALQIFYDWLATQPGAIGQWNHPTYVSSNFVNFDFWTEERDKGMGIVEVWNDDWFYTESSYIMALDKGWHVMPAANSDTHSPNWISGYEMRTVLLAPSLTPADLYEAMSASRGYATLDKNLRIYYTLNGEVMGSTLSPMTAYEVSVHIEDPDGDAITLVEIVSDGGEVVASLDVDSAVVDWTITLTSDTAHYFYVRVSTASSLSNVLAADAFGGEGVMAVTAPVWTGR